MAALAGMQEIIGHHGSPTTPARLMPCALEHLPVVLDVLIDLAPAGIFENRLRAAKVTSTSKTGSPARPTHGQIPRLALAPAKRQAHQLRSPRLQVGSFQIDRKTRLFLQVF